MHSSQMSWTLANLDNGLFFEKGRWTCHCDLADKFTDLETVSRMAADHRIENAAAAMISGNPQRPLGFLWLTKPN
jgi:hypothetical protein